MHNTNTTHTHTHTHAQTQIISINCGNDEFHCDDARNIIEAPSHSTRWSAITHFYTPLASKEAAKAHFGFSQVPFYVCVVEGEVASAGTKRTFDFGALPGVGPPKAPRTSSPTCVTPDPFDNEERKSPNRMKVVGGGADDDDEPTPPEPPRHASFEFTMDEDF